MSFIIIGSIGVAASIAGEVVSANGASNAATAQGQIAMAQEARANQAMAFAAPTAAELNTLNSQIDNYSQAHAQAQSTLSTLGTQIQKSYGDNIIQMGQQLHDQLSGQDSGIAKSAQVQLDRQRQQLQQSLVEKMGPGALTSTAGIQALNNFDLQSTNQMANLRQNTISTMVGNLSSMQGSESSAVQGINSVNSSLSGMLNQIQGAQAGIQTRQANAAIGTISSQGGQYVQAVQQGKADQALGTGIASIGANITGQALGAGIKAANPTPMTDSNFTAPTLGGSSPFAGSPAPTNIAATANQGMSAG